MNLWVTVPFFNEKKTLPALFQRLDEMSGSFNVMFCDNASTDNSKSILLSLINTSKTPNKYHIITEPLKGTGAAADTAIKEAIKLGGTHILRTDADCLPEFNWVEYASEQFRASPVEFIAGKIIARTDDTPLTKWQEKVFNTLPRVAAFYGKYRPLNKGKQFKGPYVMTAGCNLAITSELYLLSGGFPRTKIEDTHEDHVLVNRVREKTSQYCYDSKLIVAVSARRISEWGIVNSLKWYANHSYKPLVVDIR